MYKHTTLHYFNYFDLHNPVQTKLSHNAIRDSGIYQAKSFLFHELFFLNFFLENLSIMLSTIPVVMLSCILTFFIPIVFTINLCFGNNLYHFSLPLFDERGVKICTISGKRADLIDSENFNLSDITIQFFSKDKANPRGEIYVTSDRANINSAKNIAAGGGFITIFSDEFSATGNDWQFSGNSKNFTLNKNVQVFFKKTQIDGK
jgi:hypothetical protein